MGSKYRLTVGELRGMLASRPADELVTIGVDGWYYFPVEVSFPVSDDEESLITTVLAIDTDNDESAFDCRFDC